ncbi:MAG: hypothetical protein Q7S01_02950 [bacterium]|nr:hypothetical protein [bacterium]
MQRFSIAGICISALIISAVVAYAGLQIVSAQATATLTLHKVVINNNGGAATTTDWTLQASGTTPLSGVDGSAAVTNAAVEPDTYSLGEFGPSGYTSAGWVCTGTGNQTDSNTIVLGANQNATCTITNDDVATVRVHTLKYLDGLEATSASANNYQFPVRGTWKASNINGGATTTVDFLLGVNAGGAPEQYGALTEPLASPAYFSLFEIPNTVDGTSQVLPIGAQCEAGKYRLLGYSSSVAGFGDAAIQPISTSTPEFINLATDRYLIVWNENCDTPKLTVNKVVINDDGGEATVPNFTLFIDNSTTTSGVASSTTVGAHVVSEAPDSEYTGTISGDCDSNGNVTLAAGENKTCTITNNDIAATTTPPTLTVNKVVINDDGGTATTTDFTLFIDNATTTSGVASTTSVGAHVVSEGAHSGYAATIGGDCDASGNITLASGENKTCTITNNDIAATTTPPTLTVNKVVINNDGGTATTSDFTLFIDNATTTSGTTATTTVGAHVVSEGAHAGYAETISGDCDSNGNVTLAAGENKTCTITNNDIAATTTLKVHILKYLDGAMATASSSNNYQFPMTSTWQTANLNGGATTTGSFVLGNFHGGAADQYGADTSAMEAPAYYTTSEITDNTSLVLPPEAQCETGKYRLVGYSTSTISFADAALQPSSTSTPEFIGLNSDRFVIVRDVTCTTPTPPPSNVCSLSQAPSGYTLQNGTPGHDNVTLAPNTMFVGMGGNDRVTAGDGNYIICTGTGNDRIRTGNGDVIIDAGDGNNSVVTGDGTGDITTGSKNDKITTGTGTHTINAGDGNNNIRTGDGDQMVTTDTGNDKITTGNGNDTVSAGNGNNNIKTNGGTDTITAGTGNDKVDGGSGTDSCNADGGFNSVTNCP